MAVPAEWDNLKIPFKFSNMHLSLNVYGAFKRAGIPTELLDELTRSLNAIFEERDEYFRQSFLAIEQWAERHRGGEVFVMSMPGALALATASPVYPPFQTGKIRRITAHLGTTGTSNTTVKLHGTGGTTIGTLTLGSGVADVSLDVDYNVGDNDVLYWEVSAIGTGAADLSALGRVE